MTFVTHNKKLCEIPRVFFSPQNCFCLKAHFNARKDIPSLSFCVNNKITVKYYIIMTTLR